jgi:hypothetical protein
VIVGRKWLLLKPSKRLSKNLKLFGRRGHSAVEPQPNKGFSYLAEATEIF